MTASCLCDCSATRIRDRVWTVILVILMESSGCFCCRRLTACVSLTRGSKTACSLLAATAAVIDSWMPGVTPQNKSSNRVTLLVRLPPLLLPCSSFLDSLRLSLFDSPSTVVANCFPKTLPLFFFFFKKRRLTSESVATFCSCCSSCFLVCPSFCRRFRCCCCRRAETQLYPAKRVTVIERVSDHKTLIEKEDAF